MIARSSQNFIALLFLLATFFVGVSCTPSSALIGDEVSLESQPPQSLLDKFSNQEVVEMTIVTNLDSIINHRNVETYLPASFTYIDEFDKPHTLEAKVRTRGKFRRMVCEFPPLKLKFPKKALEAAGMSSFNELKLVTHCIEDIATSKNIIMREYLAYKLYNELTPNSLRAQLVKVTYKDTNDPKLKMTRWGFLIEDVEELAARTGGAVCENCLGRKPEEFNIAQEKIASVFQYMIGNTDWDLAAQRNLEMLVIKDKVVPVPYDFDFSAMVSAPYARLNGDLGQKSLTERYYLGLSKDAKDLYSTFSYFRSKKNDLYSVVNDFGWMDEETKTAILTYFNSFYTAIETGELASQGLKTKHD